ncbi:MAG: hypothetical protein K0R75_3103, partial [Paenibacillaceae bacterium]|nr:hypothetical protein [Paenibacillaceae bacterium]
QMTDPFHFTGSASTLLTATGNHEHPSMDVKNGHYILFWSGGVGNQTSYTINYATASGPLGTFTPSAENPIMYSWQTAGVIAPGATSVVLDGDGNRWMVYRQKVDDGTNWNRVVTVNRLVIDTSGNVDILPTRNTYVHKPVPLFGSLPEDELQTRIENDDNRVSYTGTWTLDSSASDSGGSSKFAKNAGDKASLTFYGDSIRVGIRTGINSGKVDIRLDGTVVANNVDTYSDPTQYQQLIYENDGLTLGNHTISFEATGSKNALAGATSVRLDYFEYHGQTIADNESSLVTYHGSDFHTWNNAGDYDGSITSSQTAGDYVQYTFDGTHVKIYARKAPAAGKVDVYLDGVLVLDNYDLYRSSIQNQVLVYDSGTISAGNHTVKYQTTGQKNSASSGYGNNFDYLVSDN